MKAVVAAFNQEKALGGAFSVIVQPVVEPMDQFAALIVTFVTRDAGWYVCCDVGGGWHTVYRFTGRVQTNLCDA